VADNAEALIGSVERMKARLKRVRFGPPVAYVYSPLDYAWPIARAYYERYGRGPKEILFIGMNPGPFGMGQTGVPFGEIAAVRDYMRLAGVVATPRRTHPKRPVLGLGCPRSEISGQRLWGAFSKRWPNVDDFFARAFVLNYCPLLFLGASAVNITPDKIGKVERKKMEAICDKSLAETIAILEPKYIVGIGNYATKRATIVTEAENYERSVINMPHPSPASPAANANWENSARTVLVKAGIDIM
jgi:single-strand selective monofunctional uracil DNA glycosylase